MKKLFYRFLCFLGKSLLSLRYRVEIRGKENLNRKNLHRGGGILFMPNHPAHLDPVFIIMNLWMQFKMRPLVIEYVFRQRFIHMLMKIVRALPIPNFESSINEIKLKKAEESMDKIIKGLKRKEAFLIYPSGRLKHTGKEILGGASAAHNILEQCPNTNVVLIRTTGLWGSSFSRALEKKSPDIKRTFLKGCGVLLRNLIFFTPRRRVVIEIEVNPQGFPYNSSRIDFNRYLENWYNRYPVQKKIVDEEPLQLVSYSFFRKSFPEVKGTKVRAKSDETSPIPQKNRDMIYKELSNLSQIPVDKIHDDMNLALDLGLDSLDIAGVVAYLSDHFDNLGEVHPEDIESVRDVLEVSEGQKFGGREEDLIPGLGWPKEKKERFPPEMPVGKTIMESFLRACERMGNVPACADDLLGVLSYPKMKKAVLVLALQFQKMPGKHIGVLLPASCISYIVILAIMMANKIPVMLNWSLGPKYLNDTVQQTGVKVVISSWKFLERLSYVEFGDLIKKIKLLEDIKKEISFSTKIQGLFRSFRSYRVILKRFGLYDKSPDSTAVILFTSGTEATPKGVPLTHKNILSNQSSALQCIHVTEKDILYGILPPFHSFGFSVAGLFPILVGMRVAFYPDPTDGFALAKGIVRWNVTMFCSAPSFLKGLLHAASKSQLSKVRLFVTGAEKTPQELFDRVKDLGANKALLEGYGITECSPILTITRMNLPPIGVGQAVPGVEICTVHPETTEPLPMHSEGEICVRGPNVFSGYLNNSKSPFIELHGKKWYRTGDLGYLDKRGNLILSGRLKRFAKIGGEMVSLGGIEGVISKTLQQKDEETSFAVCVNEKDETKSQLILFTTQDVEKKQINDILKEAGFSRLVKITDIKKLEEIPLTGTGKTDYRKLQAMVEE